MQLNEREIKKGIEKGLRMVCKALIEKAEEGDKKMIFGRPFEYSGGKWKPTTASQKKEEPKGEKKPQSAVEQLKTPTGKPPIKGLGANKPKNQKVKGAENYNPKNDSDEENPKYMHSTQSTSILQGIRDGKLDPKAMAVRELWNRGLDATGKYVGFKRGETPPPKGTEGYTPKSDRDEDHPDYAMQTTSSALLAGIATGKIDSKVLAERELKDRGVPSAIKSPAAENKPSGKTITPTWTNENKKINPPSSFQPNYHRKPDDLKDLANDAMSYSSMPEEHKKYLDKLPTFNSSTILGHGGTDLTEFKEGTPKTPFIMYNEKTKGHYLVNPEGYSYARYAVKLDDFPSGQSKMHEVKNKISQLRDKGHEISRLNNMTNEDINKLHEKEFGKQSPSAELREKAKPRSGEEYGITGELEVDKPTFKSGKKTKGMWRGKPYMIQEHSEFINGKWEPSISMHPIKGEKEKPNPARPTPTDYSNRKKQSLDKSIKSRIRKSLIKELTATIK